MLPLKDKEKSRRVPKNMHILPEAVEHIANLAAAYNTTEGRALEAILETYVPGLIREKENAK